MRNLAKLLQKAEKLLQKQKFDSAREIYLLVFKDQPRNEAVLLNLADLSVRLGKTEDSLRFHRLLADLYVERRDFPKAIASCRKVLKANPHDAAILSKLGSLLKTARKPTEAAQAFREAAAAHRRNGSPRDVYASLRHLADLEPENLEVHMELAEAALASDKPGHSALALLKAAGIARSKGMQDRWAELAVRACQLDPSNKAACVAAAEVYLFRSNNAEAMRLLEPISQSDPKNTTALKLLCQAYLASGDYVKAEPVCLKLYQAHPETRNLTEQLIRGLLRAGETAKALTIVEGIKDQMYRREEKRAEFVALIEQIYYADENNLDVLELLPPLYNDLNREGDLRRALTRLFNLYLAAEQYNKAAETLESILDADPYGAAHADRLLNLEGHIDSIWYSNIANRISVSGTGRGSVPGASGENSESATTPMTLDDLIVEAEMFNRYHLNTKLHETLQKIDRLYPGAHEENRQLRELYDMAGFHPTPVVKPLASGAAVAQDTNSMLSVEELAKVSTITTAIHRQSAPERILSVAAEELARLLKSSRCWIAVGPPDSISLTAEFVAPSAFPTDARRARKLHSFLLSKISANPEGISIDDVLQDQRAGPVAAELHLLGVSSLLAIPLAEKDPNAGLMLLEQCDGPRHWSDSEKALARAVASQLTIAINNTRLRRLVRSLAGVDTVSGLLPRSAYIDCLLAEVERAEEHILPLSVCLVEPAGVPDLVGTPGEGDMQSCIQRMGKAITAHVRQNDIAIRYGPHTIALCLSNTPLAQARILVEKLRTSLPEIESDGRVLSNFRAVVAQMSAVKGADPADSVTELINRLEDTLDIARKHGNAGIILA